MTSIVHLDLPGSADLSGRAAISGLAAAVCRTAACLGAIGYGPHEVQRLTASELGLSPDVVGRIMRLWRADVPSADT